MKNVIWITGGSSGIGKAVALKFANKGWQVIISSRREEVLKDISDKFLADKKTIMRLNNKIKSGININVRDLYKTGPMKKIR